MLSRDSIPEGKLVISKARAAGWTGEIKFESP